MTAKQGAQQIIGLFLYYALAVNFTMLVALGSLARKSNASTERTMSEIVWFLDYCATHPGAIITYTASNMHLWISRDASYLLEPTSRSCAGRFFFLRDARKYQQTNGLHLDTTSLNKPTPNAPIHVLTKIMNNVMNSEMEAKVGATFHNAQDAYPLRVTLEEMGHLQSPTPIQVENTTTVGFANKKLNTNA